MSAKQIIAIVMSALLLAVSAFSIAWGVINFNKVKDGLSGVGLYTQDDVQNAYEDGYDTALDNKQEYEDLIEEYRDKLSDYEIIKKELAVSKDNINELNEKVYQLQKYVAECEALIDKMSAENYQLKNQIKGIHYNSVSCFKIFKMSCSFQPSEHIQIIVAKVSRLPQSMNLYQIK